MYSLYEYIVQITQAVRQKCTGFVGRVGADVGCDVADLHITSGASVVQYAPFLTQNVSRETAAPVLLVGRCDSSFR